MIALYWLNRNTFVKFILFTNLDENKQTTQNKRCTPTLCTLVSQLCKVIPFKCWKMFVIFINCQNMNLIRQTRLTCQWGEDCPTSPLSTPLTALLSAGARLEGGELRRQSDGPPPQESVEITHRTLLTTLHRRVWKLHIELCSLPSTGECGNYI